MEINCTICKKILTEEDTILAFDIFTPSESAWEDVDILDGFDEVMPDSGFWNLACYSHFFKESE